MFLHNTIRKYTLAILDFFNEIEVQHKTSDESIVTKKIPITYRNREKHQLMDKSYLQQISGNMNILPLGTLTLTGINKSTERSTSKYNRFTKKRSDDNIQYMYNPVPYDFSFDVTYLCRGMNEACQIIEEVCPKFNPNIAIDVYDSENQDEPSRIPFNLNGVSYEFIGFDEFSMNLIKVTFTLNMAGWLFPPIKDYSKIKEFNINLHTPQQDVESLSFNVQDGNIVPPPTITKYTDTDDNLYFKNLSLVKNDDVITLSYETNSRNKPNIKFVSDDCIINQKNNKSNTCTVQKKIQSSLQFTICAIIMLNNERVSILKTFDW